jgi:glycosyltransferase involved in cell wall biosynthesis
MGERLRTARAWSRSTRARPLPQRTMCPEENPDSKALVSVIVPVFNGERFLRPALESVLAQDYRPFELLVVDDGSSDGSAAIARSFAEVTYLNQPNAGVAAARNAGLAAARGQFIAFLDQDDQWVAGKLRIQIEYLEAHPEIDFLRGYVCPFLEPGIAPPRWLKPEHLESPFPSLEPGSWLVRRSAFERVGLLDSSFRTGDDSDWFVRARDAGLAMDTLPETLLLKRIHGANLSYEENVTRHEWMRILKESIHRRRH